MAKSISQLEFEKLVAFEKRGLLYNTIVQKSDLAIKTITFDGIITSWNVGAEHIYGYLAKEIIGNHINVLIPENIMSEVEDLLEKIKNGTPMPRYITKRIRKNGSIIDISLFISVIEDENGEAIGICTMDRDITYLTLANDELILQNSEKEKLAQNLEIADKELAFLGKEKIIRANELVIANKELLFQNSEKEKRADELGIANNELIFQNSEKEKRADELLIANEELIFQNSEKGKRADELLIANEELIFQNSEKEKRADELLIANEELKFQNSEKEKRANELSIANEELIFQNNEKGKRAKESRELEAFSDVQTRASQYARSLIEASLDPLFTIDKEGKIRDLNQATIDVTDVSRENLIGSDFSQYFTEPAKAKRGYEEVFKNGFVSDYPLTIKDHKLTGVLFNGSVYKNEVGIVLGAVVVARDITVQKRFENELIESKVLAEISAEVANRAKMRAEDAVKSKQQFLSNMSHEIRTPMNAIIGFTKVVLKTELTTEQKEYVLAIKMSGDALIVLINDILDLAKVDAGKMTFEKTPFQMKSSINVMLHIFETKMQEKNLKLISHYDTKIPNVLVGDAVRLHQIILNLVSNAVKFTNEGTVTVDVKLVNEDAQYAYIQFTVSDTGIGIAESELGKIFENFEQASSSTSRLFGGTGLGLAIVKKLVEAQGGKITVKSKVQKGSEFSFVLNYIKTTQTADTDIGLAEINTTVKDVKVLVVEDIELNQLLMKTLLDDFGFESDMSSNGKLAIEKLKLKPYDIILMDLQMPIMNGFDTTAYIRNVMKSNIPIMALTADVTTVDVQKCIAVGMNDYISKPVDERILYTKMIQLIQNTKQKEIMLNEEIVPVVKVKCTDLEYLKKRTKSNPELMKQMIDAFLSQTPLLIHTMKTSVSNKDWKILNATVHKLIPSFSIMGIHTDYENIAKKIQEYTQTLQGLENIEDLVTVLESIFFQSFEELNEELISLNMAKSEQ